MSPVQLDLLSQNIYKGSETHSKEKPNGTHSIYRILGLQNKFKGYDYSSSKEKDKFIITRMQDNHKDAQDSCQKASSNYREASSYDMCSIPSKAKVLRAAKAEE
ncbi:5140_t:CDS:2 [Scutellospora calospora]|uniref:5140_t:CDS:1 n=1 Tax=Scutellospora calospora TaxID=85575 RepID=A0ACA9KFN2_9GLOM|nr:5140_t:CDS:2 [Scutellospora calospora]